jgi:hypothetical protein
MTRTHAVRSILSPLVIVITAPLARSLDPYILCPLGSNPVNLERDQLTRNWYVTSDPSNSTIQAKPCWCVTLGDQYPAFCPNQFDTCRIEDGFRVTCLQLDAIEMTLGDWFIAFMTPFIILPYVGLLLACCLSRRGMACRDYVLIHVLSRLGHDPQERYAYWMDMSLRHTTLRFQEWACHVLELHRRRRSAEQEREQTISSWTNEDSAARWTEPTRVVVLELQTKIYHTSTNESLLPVVGSESSSDIPTAAGTGMNHPEQTLSLHGHDQEQFNESPDDGTSTSCQPDVAQLSMVETTTFDDDDNDGVLCAICYCHLEEGNRIGNIPCRHLFHVHCLKPWIRKKNQCPICSAPTIATPKV